MPGLPRPWQGSRGAALVDAIGRVAAARENSTNYQDIELVFAEWGPDLATRAGDQQYAATMDPALHAATVVTLGASSTAKYQDGVAIFTLPTGILISFIVMHHQGINSNIMSLGGIAIAIGARPIRAQSQSRRSPWECSSSSTFAHQRLARIAGDCRETDLAR